jgi:hypothetical protein
LGGFGKISDHWWIEENIDPVRGTMALAFLWNPEFPEGFREIILLLFCMVVGESGDSTIVPSAMDKGKAMTSTTLFWRFEITLHMKVRKKRLPVKMTVSP